MGLFNLEIRNKLFALSTCQSHSKGRFKNIPKNAIEFGVILPNGQDFEHGNPTPIFLLYYLNVQKIQLGLSKKRSNT